MHTLTIGRGQIGFSSAHFVYSETFREPLHGHNYQVGVSVQGSPGPDRFVMNFLELKKITRELVRELDHRFLLPERNTLISVAKKVFEGKPVVELRCAYGEVYVLPSEGVCPLPVQDTTVEDISSYLCFRLKEALKRRSGLKLVKVEVCESPGFCASTSETLEPS